MLIQNTKKIDLTTIDLGIEADNAILTKLPSTSISEDAKAAWVHEINADIVRLQEMRPGYLDGRTEARHARDTVVMLMNVSLISKFMNMIAEKKC